MIKIGSVWAKTAEKAMYNQFLHRGSDARRAAIMSLFGSGVGSVVNTGAHINDLDNWKDHARDGAILGGLGGLGFAVGATPGLHRLGTTRRSMVGMDPASPEYKKAYDYILGEGAHDTHVEGTAVGLLAASPYAAYLGYKKYQRAKEQEQKLLGD